MALCNWTAIWDDLQSFPAEQPVWKFGLIYFAWIARRKSVVSLRQRPLQTARTDAVKIVFTLRNNVIHIIQDKTREMATATQHSRAYVVGKPMM